MASTDADLVHAARGGDRDALAALIDRHRPLLLALCRKTLRDPLLAEDAAHEAILQAMLSLDALRRPDRFGSWLAGIGLNMCRRMRTRYDRELWSLDALYGGRLHREIADHRPDPAALAEEAELTARIRAAVNDLPSGQRAAVLLFYLSGLTLAETAATLGIEVGAVKTRLHKARRTLRADLWDSWKELTMTVQNEAAMIAMHVEGVRVHPAQDDRPKQYVVALHEVDGDRRLLIWVGPPEAQAIAVYHQRIETPRPLTFAFLGDVMAALGGRLSEVRINRLAEEVFYAEAVLATSGGEKVVDARPSDAIALALSQDAPIRVEASLLESVGTSLEHRESPESKWLKVERTATGLQPVEE